MSQTYRNTDPITSRQEVKNKLGLQDIALKAIAKHPDITAGELERITHVDGLWKRLPEMEAKGLIERTGVAVFLGTGKSQTTWKIREQQLQLLGVL
mgnify:CR=1 FL=1